MHVRIWRNDNGAVGIGRTQRLLLGAIEGEIDEPVVHEIDRQPLR
jgi:hypothetical protein